MSEADENKPREEPPNRVPRASRRRGDSEDGYKVSKGSERGPPYLRLPGGEVDMKTTTRYVYFLIDPRDGRVRYVGETSNPAGRLERHRRGEVMRTWAWSIALKKACVRPIMRIVAECTSRAESRELEKRWMKEASEKNGRLLNHEILGT
jgi:hypothetical protein